MQALQSPFPFIADLSGAPLSLGSLYLGVENDNPETAPTTVYWDAAGTQPAAQPISIRNGYPSRNGTTPTLIYFAQPVSITVRDAQNRIVINAPSTRDLTVGFLNPMTTAGDLIKGGTAGAAQRLAVGTNGQVLTVVSGAPAWQSPVVGFANPMTAAGDLIKGGTLGAAERLGAGANGQVLTIAAGVPTWTTPAAGYVVPTTYSCCLVKNAAQAAAGTVIFTNASFAGGHNDATIYNVTTGVATVPAGAGGDYLVTFTGWGIVVAVAGSIVVSLRVNGAQVTNRGFGSSELGSTGGVGISGVLRLNAGDTVQIYIESVTGGGQLGAESMFSMRRLSLT